MSQRGMKKWAPFQALPEQNSFTISIKSSKKQESEKELSEDQICEIESILNNYNNETLEIEYFNKTTHYITGTITKIDLIEKILYILLLKFSLFLPN